MASFGTGVQPRKEGNPWVTKALPTQVFYPKDSYSHPVQLDLLFRQVRSSPFLPPAGSFLLGSVGLRTALLISPTPIHKVSRATHASDESRFWAYMHACNPSTQRWRKEDQEF